MSAYGKEQRRIMGVAQARAIQAEAENKALKQSLENGKRYLQDKDMMLAASAMAMQKVVNLLCIMRNNVKWGPMGKVELEAKMEIDRIVDAQVPK
jgi:hypothetical protein